MTKPPGPFTVQNFGPTGWVPMGLPGRYDGLAFPTLEACKAWFAGRCKRNAYRVAWDESADPVTGRFVPGDS